MSLPKICRLAMTLHNVLANNMQSLRWHYAMALPKNMRYTCEIIRNTRAQIICHPCADSVAMVFYKNMLTWWRHFKMQKICKSGDDISQCTCQK
jgi:hypothetical protein